MPGGLLILTYLGLFLIASGIQALIISSGVFRALEKHARNMAIRTRHL